MPTYSCLVKPDIYGFLSPWRVLSIRSALLVLIDISSASESAVIRYIFLLTVHGLVRRPDPLLECHIASIFACCCGPEPESASKAGSTITVLAINIIELIVDSAAPFCYCSFGVLK